MDENKRYYVDLDEAIIDNNTNREFTTWDISGVEDIAELLNNKEEKIDCLKTDLDKYKTLFHGKQKDYMDLKSMEYELKEEIRELEAMREGFLIELNKKDEHIKNLEKENENLNELIRLIANASCADEFDNVKEILRWTIWGADSVAGEYAGAWHDYCILSKFFKQHYNEEWDNFD